MCKKLVLVRHGDAEARGPQGDISRRLTKDGLTRLKAAYPAAFAQIKGEDDLVLWSSPATRALETAGVVADSLGLSRDDIEEHQCLYEQDSLAFRDELDEATANTVVAVGHVPFMARMASALTGEEQSFPKGTVLALDVSNVESEPAKVLWSVVP